MIMFQNILEWCLNNIEIVGIILSIIASIVTIVGVINNKAKGNSSKSTDSNTSQIKKLSIDFLECANTIFNDKRLYEDYDIAIELLTTGPSNQYETLENYDIDQGFALFLGAKDDFITKNSLPKSIADVVVAKIIDLFPDLFKQQHIPFEPNDQLVFRIKSKNLITQIGRDVIGINSDQITLCIDRLKSGSCDQYLKI